MCKRNTILTPLPKCALACCPCLTEQQQAFLKCRSWALFLSQILEKCVQSFSLKPEGRLQLGGYA